MDRPPRPTYAAPTARARPPEAGKTQSVLTPRAWMVLVVLFGAILFSLVKGVLTLMGHPYALDKFVPALIAVAIIIYAGGVGFHLTLKNVVGAVFDFGLAGLYLFAWVAPEALGEGRLSYLFWLVPVEFVAISCAFGVAALFQQESAWNRIKILGVLLGLVGSSIAISYIANHWWPLAAVAVLGANQILSSLRDRETGRSADCSLPPWFVRWALFLVVLWLLSEWELHELGWTDFRFTVVDNQPASTHSVIAFGFYYFLSAGLYEMTRQVPGTRSGRPPLP